MWILVKAQRLIDTNFQNVMLRCSKMIKLLLLPTGLCGGIYNATSTQQTAMSPNFPNAYAPFTVCIWIIDAPPQEEVKLTVETFRLHSSQDCSQNYLEFQDRTMVRLAQCMALLKDLSLQYKEDDHLISHYGYQMKLSPVQGAPGKSLCTTKDSYGKAELMQV